MKIGSPEARFARVRAVAQAALEWERWAPAILPAILLLLAYIALALLGLWEAVGDPWRALALIATLGGGAALAVLALRRSRPVSFEATLRRIEEDSGLEGRPFEALTDTPAALRANLELWRAHVLRMAARAQGARAGRPRAALARLDTMAGRIAAVVVVLLAFAVAGDRGPGRLSDAFATGFLEGGGAEPLVDAWINPPGYTGAPPIFLTAQRDGAEETTYRAPAGSELTVRVSGVRRPPAARLRDEEGRTRLRFEALSNEVHEAKATLATDAVLTVRRSGQWRIATIGDLPPQAAFAAAPESENNSLRISYRASDDYGVVSLGLVIAHPDDPEETEETRIDLGGVAAAAVEGQPLLDLTEHRWAGERVTMRLRAVDALGQEGLSEPVDARIPERIFLSPLARAVAEQRKTLLNAAAPYADLPDMAPMTAEDAAALPDFAEDHPERRIDRAPEGVRRAADMLSATLVGGERYFTDYAVFLGLAEARSQLQQAREQADIADVPPQLWRIALRVELGDLADAEAALRAAERALLEAMARGADQDELNQLFDAFEEAMNRYLEALAREAIENGNIAQAPEGGQMPPGMDMQSVQDLLDAIREASELGDEAGARAALAALSELLRNMEMQLVMGGGGQGGQREQTPEQRAMQNALDALSDMIGEQRDLMDQTQQQGGGDRQGEQGQDGQQQGQQQGGGQPGGQGGQNDGPAGQPGQQGGQQAGQGQPGGADGDLAGQQGQNPGTQGGGRQGQGISPSELANRQGGLADRLGQLGDIPGQDQGDGMGGQAGGDPGDGDGRDAAMLLDRAREAMREAEQALRNGQGGEALRAQQEALNAMREGARQLAERANDAQEGQDANRQVLDPLGRTAGGTAGPGDSVIVPDEMERARARDILDELRRRAGERRRPAQELDYLRRLLERF